MDAECQGSLGTRDISQGKDISYFPAIPGTATKLSVTSLTGAVLLWVCLLHARECGPLPLHTNHLCFCFSMTNCQITTSEWNDETLYAGINGLKH